MMSKRWIIKRNSIIRINRKNEVQVFGVRCIISKETFGIRKWIENILLSIDVEFASFLFNGMELYLVLGGSNPATDEDHLIKIVEQEMKTENQLVLTIIQGIELVKIFPFCLQDQNPEEKSFWKTDKGLKVRGYLIDNLKLNNLKFDFLEWLDYENVGISIGYRKEGKEWIKAASI